MNKLYGLILFECSPSDNPEWFIKRTTTTKTTARAQALADIILTGVPAGRCAMFASVVCYMVSLTQFGKEIAALDPNNTYVPVVRDPDVDHSAESCCMHDLIRPIGAYETITTHLDKDIYDRVDKNSWLDMMGAACLQMLREVA